MDPLVLEQIEADIKRTAGRDVELSAGLDIARAMLTKYAREDSELGYCQGMNMVAALFAVAACSEDAAYARFEALTQRLRGLWLPGFPLLQTGIAAFTSLSESRPWFQHLSERGVSPDLYLPQAWMTLFATWLPLPTRILLLQVIETAGLAGLLATAHAILDEQASRLLQHSEGDDLLAELASLQLHPPLVADLQIAINACLPAASVAAAQSEEPSKNWLPRLIRVGGCVLDGEGRELLFRGVAQHLSTGASAVSSQMRQLAGRTAAAHIALWQWASGDPVAHGACTAHGFSSGLSEASTTDDNI